MANFIGPYWVEINYHGALAPHSMSVPTKNWNPGSGNGTFDVWSGGTESADSMINSLVTLLLPFYNSDTVFDNYQIMKQLLPTDKPQPVTGNDLGAAAGTDTSASWAAAVQGILIARTEAFGIAKLTFLDMVSDNDFKPIITPTTRITNLIAAWMDVGNGWSGRDNSRPATFLKLTKDLNDKLRHDYHYD